MKGVKGFQKGHKHSEETIQKIIASKVKNPTRYWLGKKRSEEDKKKFRDSHLGQVPWNKDKKGVQVGWNKGLHPEYMQGSNHPNWKGGVSNQKGRYSRLSQNYKALKRGALGSFSRKEWFELKFKYSYMCLCCKKQEPEISLEADHVVPLSKGGDNFIENIQPLCRSCNSIKRAKFIDYRISSN